VVVEAAVLPSKRQRKLEKRPCFGGAFLVCDADQGKTTTQESKK
jgi:hypothetical protein